MSSPIAFDDTQFDLDLSDHLDQFRDGSPPAASAAPAAFDAVVPVGDPWGAPTDAATPAVATSSVAAASSVVVSALSDASRPGVASSPAGESIPGGESAVVGAAEGVAEVPGFAAVAPAAEGPAFAATTVEDVPTPWTPPVDGTATLAAAVARAVDPPTSVHSVFAVTPAQGTPVVAVPPVPPAPPVVADPGAARRARRRRRGVAVLAVVLAAGLVAGGAGLAVATSDGGGDGDVAAASSPGATVALPPAGAEADKPADAEPGDAVVPPAADPGGDDAVVPPAVEDPADPDRAADAVTTFLAVRGTDDERAVSSQGGRDELDATIAAIGRAVPEGDPACSPGADAATFACVLATDQGPITFTVGPDADDPQTSGFEVIGASA